MSRAWRNGTTPQWRKLRTTILKRDNYQCQAQLPNCTGKQPHSLTGKHQAHIHHTKGRALTGDNPNHLITTCRNCNLTIGDPTQHKHDPKPKPTSQW